VRRKWLEERGENYSISAEVSGIFDTFRKALPAPTNNPVSAARNCLSMDYGIGGWGGYELDGRSKITISARSIQRVLAGQVTIEEFNEAHGWNTAQSVKNPFASALSHGRTISSICRRPVSENDDDKIEISFELDPALLPFE
jgi:hypothetical protein